MKIAVITSGILPVPAVQGGAVENLIDFYLEYNDIHKLHDITVYSVYHPDVKTHPALQSKVNHYQYINTHSLLFRIGARFFSYIGKHYCYHHILEYFFEQVWKKMKSQKYDLIILENRPGFSIKLSERTKTPLIAHIHFDMLNKPDSLDIFNPLTGIITVSSYLYSKSPSVIRKKCITVYNGIKLSNFYRSTPKERANLRTAYNIKESEILLVYSGRIDPIKGVKELIMSLIQTNDNHIKLLIIGGAFYEDNTNDNDYIISLKNMTNTIKDRIIFTGYKPYSEIPQLLSMADVAVIPSLCDDAFPTTILEAMSIGLPIIATHRGGIPEAVNNDNSILIDTDMDLINNMSNAIQRLANDSSLRKKMADASLKISHFYNKERYAKEFFEAICHFVQK